MKKALLIAALLLVATYLFVRPPPQNLAGSETFQLTDLPWQIEIDQNGDSTIFGQTLGTSTLRELEKKLGQPATIRVFRSQDNSLTLEAFFKKVSLARIDSKLVARLQSTKEALAEFESRALKRKVTATGSYKLELSQADEERALDAKIIVISWSPRFMRLDDEMITERFGVADEIIETEEEVAHWLYPKLGLDIIRLPRNKTTLHYISPNQFEQVKEELILQKREADD
ncbi:MAG: hypothetical protein DRQ61_09375 [Gammaproteobacteria bacterium]|nr:MAG: hypothetical protein DRQ61_09375 [Gammaproteobacteria bacterium]